MKKRILAGILCFCVILTSLPTAVLAVEGTGNPASNSADSQNTPQLTPLGLLADDTNYDPDLAVEDDGNGIEETNPPETSFRGVVPVPPGYFLNQDPKQNEDLLEQISSITEENADEIYNALQALGLLDEEGNLNVNQTVNLNGEELTLEQVMDLLEDENTDLSQIANVDGVPIALGDLKIIIRIEMELARIQETYFSGKTFTEEALYNLNSLIEQIERDGIKIHDGTSPPEDEEVGDLVPPTDGEPEEPEEGPEEEPEEDSEEELPLEEPEEDSEEEPFVEKPEKDPEEDSRMEAPINLDESLGIIQPSSMGLGPSRMQMMGSSTGTSEPPDNELGRLKIIEMYGYLWNDRRQSENFKLFGGETIEFSYRINSYQINNSESYDCLMYMDVYAYGNDNNFTEVSISEKKDDGSYFFSYTADWDEGVSKSVCLRAKPGYSPNPGLYVYGQLHIYLELYGGENIVFYDGQTYDSRASIRLYTAEYNDNIKFGTKMEYENSEGLSGEAEFFQFDDVSWRTGVRDDRNNLIETLESARNEMKGSEEATFSQPYRVNLNMSVEWANPEQLQTGRITKPRDSGSDVCKTIKILDYGVAGGPSLKGGYIEDIQNGHSNKFDISFGAKTTEIYMPQMGVGYNEFYFPIGLTTEVEEWNGSSYQSVDGASVKVYSSSVEIFDRDNPQLLSIEAREGNYSTGERIFITMTFNEIVDARNVRLEINGETYTHGDLAMNSRGVEIMGWYKVKEIDATGLTIRYLDSNEEDKVITDIFGNKLVPKGGGVGHPFDSVTIPGIQLESTLMRNAPTSFTVAFNDESKTASFSLTANMAEAYKTAIYNYHADHGDGDREAPFRIQLYKPNGEEGESLQVYLIGDESDPFSIEDYIVLEGSIDKDDIWLAVLQANEGTRDNLQWANILPLNREFTVGKLLYATDAYVKPEENTENYTLTLADTSDGELYRPVLQANLRLNDNTTSVPATTGTWSSSDEDIATISNESDSFG
ncbi:MAG TPA: hypothetical protein VFD57_07550, partial [Clostridia bacterium]|nr:hypothetical protein [Clostridia bacterium]